MLHTYMWYNLKLYDHHIAVLIDLNSLLYIYHEMCEQFKCIYIYHNVSACLTIFSQTPSEIYW